MKAEIVSASPEKPTDTPGEASGDKPSETSGDKPSETSGDKPSETSGDKPSETSDATPAQVLPTTEEREASILEQNNDDDLNGSTFCQLQAEQKKAGKNTIKISWKPYKGAEYYTVFAAESGKGNKYKEVATLKKTSYTLKKLNNKKLKKGTYYKFIVVANGGGLALSTSKVLEIATSGGKAGNPASVTVKTPKINVKINKKAKVKAGTKNGSGTVKKFKKLRYESSNPAIATVNSKGVIKGKAKGTCYVYAYAQNGIFKKITVKVK